MDFTNYTEIKQQNKEKPPPLTPSPDQRAPLVSGRGGLPSPATRAVVAAALWRRGKGARGGGWPAAVRAAAGWRRPGGARARAEAAGWTATACPSGGAKQGRRGAAVPAAVGPGGGGAKRCEHQYGRAAPVLALAWRGRREQDVQRAAAAYR
jgi:hypothetical protein